MKQQRDPSLSKITPSRKKNALCQMKKAIIFVSGMSGVGGAERIIFEEAKFLQDHGCNVAILTYNFNPATLSLIAEDYQPPIEEVKGSTFLSKVINLRKRLNDIQPDFIIVHEDQHCRFAYLATLFSNFPYVVHIHETIMWSITGHIKHALIYKKAFRKFMGSVIDHKAFVPAKKPEMAILTRVWMEFMAVLIYLGVRRAKRIFVLSEMMKREVEDLYKASSKTIVLKGAFHSNVFDYKPNKDIRKELNIENKRIILNINRLDKRKRVDLIIKAFGEIVSSDNDDIILLIGGVGPDSSRLHDLVRELELQDRVVFLGQIREKDLWDYIYCCDLFVHPNRADFAIAPFEALGLFKKVIWSTEMEMDADLRKSGLIFPAVPSVESFADVIRTALDAEGADKDKEFAIFRDYSWDTYCGKILEEIKETC